ncbi:MAG: hypothetical protein ACLU9T_17440 [Blautia faecis]
MSKKNEYRFNLRFDETDEDHRKVCQFLNDYCGSRKKALYCQSGIGLLGIRK